MRWLTGAIFAVGLVLAMSATPARAQSTGGSMGGGSFSSGGGSYSSGGSGGYYSSSGGGSGGGNGSVAGPLVVVVITGGIGLAAAARRRNRGGGNGVDVTGLSLAIDWRARKFVQAELDRIGKSADTGTSEGLNAMLRQVALALRRSRESWIYAGFEDIAPRPASDAETYFNEQADDFKARFDDELVRNQGGEKSIHTASAARRPRADEGEGLVVVTLLIAARGNISDHDDATDAEQIRGWLETASAFSTDRLVAVQIIWSPAAENDRMSSAELEVLYPELDRVRGSTLAGRVYCQYCGGPYPAELLACPHCGGKAAA